MAIELLNKAEAAELLRVSESTVERLIAVGQLPAYRIGRAITRIDRADLDAYLAARQTKLAELRQTRTLTPSQLRSRQKLREMAEHAPCQYRPGQKVVMPSE